MGYHIFFLKDFFLNPSQIANFRLSQTARVCRRQFQIWWKWQKLHKTGSPFPSVFKGLVLQTHKNQGLFGKGLRFSALPNNPKFNDPEEDNFLKHRPEKEKMLVITFSHNFSYPTTQKKKKIIWARLTLSQTTNFRLFQTERVCRRQFQIWWQWQKMCQTGRKHCV